MEFKKWFSSATKKEIILPPVPSEELIQKTERFSTALLKLKEQREQLRAIEIRPRVGVLADKGKIENQQIDIIDAEDIGYYQVTFKLTEAYYKKILEKFKGIRKDFISYGNLNSTDRFNFVEALILEIDQIVVRISNGHSYNAENYKMRSSLGLVQIEIPKEKITDPQNVEGQIASIFQTILDMTDGLEAPDQEAEQQYKLARYSWHHKKSNLSPEEAALVQERLTREEVFPGYYTFVENGKHKEYEAMSPYVIYHELKEASTLSKIIKAGGLMATHERYRRGLMFNGMSSMADLERGGGTVFLLGRQQKRG